MGSLRFVIASETVWTARKKKASFSKCEMPYKSSDLSLNQPTGRRLSDGSFGRFRAGNLVVCPCAVLTHLQVYFDSFLLPLRILNQYQIRRRISAHEGQTLAVG